MNATGSNGDFYIDTKNDVIYGPKANDEWPAAGTSLVGPEGKVGAEGPEGKQGPEGKIGAEGPEGKQGPEGPEGKPGKDGAEGPEGKIGPEGPEGKMGLTGPEGKVGLTGPEGKIGPEGKEGPKGAAGSSVMMLGGLTNENGSSTSTRYLGLFQTSPTTTESNVEMVVPAAGTVSNLSVRLGSTPNSGGGTQKYTFSVRKNGSPSGAISCEISENESTCSSTSTLSFAAGDLISLQATPSGNPSGWSTLRWAVTLTQ